MNKDWFWRVLILSIIALAFITMVPWNAPRNNFIGCISFYSFVPFATIAMLDLAVALHAWHRKRRITLYGTILILLAILGFTGWWFYVFKMPMDSLDVSLTIKSYWIGIGEVYEENRSSISFQPNIKNPASHDTPLFIIEPTSVSINDKELVSGYNLDCWNGTHQVGSFKWYYKPLILKANQNISLLLYCKISFDHVEVVGATSEEIWNAMQESFTFSMYGILTARPYTDKVPTPHVDQSVWAAKPFTVSQQQG
jgi:hypothetical protein